MPGNIGLLLIISANMQPTDHISMDFVYPFEFNMISGARYQRVATYSVRKPVWSCSGSATRASPKSQICLLEKNISTKFQMKDYTLGSNERLHLGLVFFVRLKGDKTSVFYVSRMEEKNDTTIKYKLFQPW